MTEEEGTWLGHVLEHVAIELQCLAGTPVTFGKTRGHGLPKGHYYVVYSFCRGAWRRRRRRARAVASSATCCRPAPRRPTTPGRFDLQPRARAPDAPRPAARFGPSTAALVRAAEERDIPWIRLNDRSAWSSSARASTRSASEATITSQTRHIAVEIASDKELTQSAPGRRSACRCRGRSGSATPTTRSRPRRRSATRWWSSRSTATTAAASSVNLTTAEEVRDAFDEATTRRSRRHRREPDPAATTTACWWSTARSSPSPQRVPGHVVGDGEQHHRRADRAQSTSDPRRGVGHEKVLTRIELDDQAARLLDAAAATTATACSPAGEVVLPALDRQPLDRRHGDRPDRRHPPRQPADGRARRPRRSGSTSAASTSSPPTSPRATARPAARSRGQRRPRASACTSRPPRARRATSAGPVIDMLFPPATPARIPIAAHHRHQRQDHHGAHGRAHPEDGRLTRRA